MPPSSHPHPWPVAGNILSFPCPVPTMRPPSPHTTPPRGSHTPPCSDPGPREAGSWCWGDSWHASPWEYNVLALHKFLTRFQIAAASLLPALSASARRGRLLKLRREVLLVRLLLIKNNELLGQNCRVRKCSPSPPRRKLQNTSFPVHVHSVQTDARTRPGTDQNGHRRRDILKPKEGGIITQRQEPVTTLRRNMEAGCQL